MEVKEAVTAASFSMNERLHFFSIRAYNIEKILGLYLGKFINCIEKSKKT